MRTTLIASVVALFAAAGASQALAAPPAATAAQIEVSIPSHVTGAAREQVLDLLSSAQIAETSGDDVLARSWRRLALAEIATASGDGADTIANSQTARMQSMDHQRMINLTAAMKECHAMMADMHGAGANAKLKPAS
ncbi:hypothetical protein [Indioceanicola profundi]|uniref:hypothetical protein n=1 Tax=Indioceanicola profundi TaxID=2220096 RepID=UPI000E6AE319|nr:hypothetical protein [Indioceanicola profundi]